MVRGVNKNVVEIVGGKEDDFERAILVVKQGVGTLPSKGVQSIGNIKVTRVKNTKYWAFFALRYGACILVGALLSYFLF